MALEVTIEISLWASTDYWRLKPSVDQLIYIHHDLHRRDKFARAMYMYPFGNGTLAKAFKELIPREDYEVFLARIKPSNEILGWVALSFGNEAKSKERYEAKLEWTEMCSHILKMWKVDGPSGKRSVWDRIKGTSTRLQAKHLPHNYCIINALVLYPDYEDEGVANRLLENVIRSWKKRITAGTEWALWVQAPHFFQRLYAKYGFEEVGEYAVDLGAHGFLPKEERTISGNYGWKFMVLKGIGESTFEEPEGAERLDESKSKGQPRCYAEQRVPLWEIFKDDDDEPPPLEDAEGHIIVHDADKGRGKEQATGDTQEHTVARRIEKGKGKEQPQDDAKDHVAIRTSDKGQGKEQLPEGTQERIVARKVDKGKGKEQPTGDTQEHIVMRKADKGKGKDRRQEEDDNDHPARVELSESDGKMKAAWWEAEERLEEIRTCRGPPPSPGEVARLARSLRKAEARGLDPTGPSNGKGVEPRGGNAPAAELQLDVGVISQPLTLTKSEESLLDLLRRGGVDEEEIELVKAIALSLGDEAEEE